MRVTQKTFAIHQLVLAVAPVLLYICPLVRNTDAPGGEVSPPEWESRGVCIITRPFKAGAIIARLVRGSTVGGCSSTLGTDTQCKHLLQLANRASRWGDRPLAPSAHARALECDVLADTAPRRSGFDLVLVRVCTKVGEVADRHTLMMGPGSRADVIKPRSCFIDADTTTRRICCRLGRNPPFVLVCCCFLPPE